MVPFSRMAAERHFRAFARRAVNLPAVVGTESGGTRPARLTNLGLGGACIELSGPLTRGVRRRPSRSPRRTSGIALLVPAIVTWVRPSESGRAEAGLAFDHTERTALPALVELLVAYRFE